MRESLTWVFARRNIPRGIAVSYKFKAEGA